MSVGTSVLVFLSSYRSETEDIIKSSILIPTLSLICGFLSSIVIFCFMGFMSNKTGIPIN